MVLANKYAQYINFVLHRVQGGNLDGAGCVRAACEGVESAGACEGEILDAACTRAAWGNPDGAGCMRAACESEIF